MDMALATRNKKKAVEIGRMVEGLGIRLLTLDDFPGAPDVEETGATFEGNALLKAKSAADYCKIPAIADDSGLMVDALDGGPGVYSARYAGPGANDKDNVKKLLHELSGTPMSKRGARFVCVMAIAWPNGKTRVFKGSVEGTIISEERGESGFGYDPVFVPEGHDRTFAEMSAGEKDGMSHRGRALRMLVDYVKSGMKG